MIGKFYISFNSKLYLIFIIYLGVLLEDTDRAMDQAITFQTQTLNSGYQEFRLTPNVNFTDMNNAYDVIATGKY